MISVYTYMYAVLLTFMFRNKDSFFNINNYRNGLIITIFWGMIILCITWKMQKMKITILKIFVFWSIFNMVISKYIFLKKSEPYYVLFISFLLVFLLCMGEIRFNIEQIKFLINSYIFSSFLISCIIIIQHRTPYAQYGIYRYALFFEKDKYYDVNFTSIYLLFPTLFAFYGALKGAKKNRTKYMIITVINIIAILMLGSRGTFAPVVAIMMFLILKDKKISLSKIVIIMISVFILLFLLPQDTISRLIGTSYIGTEHKRYIDWSYGIKAFSNYPFWGNGMRPPKTIVAEIGGSVMNYTIHNTYIVYLAQLGIFGSIPFYGILIYPLLSLLRKCKNLYFTLSYCGILFSIIMLEANYTYILFVPLGIMYAFLNYINRKKICYDDLWEYLFG